MEGKHTLPIILGVLLLILVVRLAWKSDGDHPPMGYVTGTVTMDGKPLAGVMIAFFPEKGRPSTAVADEEGKYELRYTRRITGTKIGPSTVHFSWDSGGSGPAIPERYGLNKSELKTDVKSGSNVFDFALESDALDTTAEEASQAIQQQVLD